MIEKNFETSESNWSILFSHNLLEYQINKFLGNFYFLFRLYLKKPHNKSVTIVKAEIPADSNISFGTEELHYIFILL